MKKRLRLGTRGSPLAIFQARIVQNLLIKLHKNFVEDDIEIISFRTSGDWRQEQGEQTFLELGGNRGLFTKEIEEALIDNRIDVAVHAMKDVAVVPPDSLTFAALLPRADVRDVFLSPLAKTLDAMPQGAVIGTSSLRRQAQVLALRPDLRVVPLRGNVDTRLRKLEEKKADATILALAGLQRLGKKTPDDSIMDLKTMLPCAGQGAIGVQCRRNDEQTVALVLGLNDPVTFACVEAERAALRVLDGSCRTPIAALALPQEQGRLALEVLVASPDGSTMVRDSVQGLDADALRLGQEIGVKLQREWSASLKIGTNSYGKAPIN